MTREKITQNVEFFKKGLNQWHPGLSFLIANPWRIALVYLVVITLAEALTILVELRVGLILHGLVLVALILHASLENQLLTRDFLITLALVPLIRLLNLAMPFQRFSQIYWYMLVGIPLFLAALYTAHIVHLNRKILGLTWRKLPLQLFIGLIGIGLGYLEYLILSPTAMISELRMELVWLPALILLIFTGLLEEFIFRGLLQYTSGRRLGRYGMLYTAVVFTVLHLGYRSLLDLAFVFIVALFFGWLVQRSGSIVGVTLAHGLINISLFLVFPFL